MGLEEAFESTGFYLLAGGGIITELIGWVIGRRSGIATFPAWQLVVMMIVTVLAAAYFATRDN